MAANSSAAAQWPIETQQDAVALTDLDNELSELEAWSSDESWELDGRILYEALEGVLEGASNGSPADAGASMDRWAQHSVGPLAHWRCSSLR